LANGIRDAGRIFTESSNGRLAFKLANQIPVTHNVSCI